MSYSAKTETQPSHGLARCQFTIRAWRRPKCLSNGLLPEIKRRYPSTSVLPATIYTFYVRITAIFKEYQQKTDNLGIMGTKTLDQALELLDRRFGLVAVHKGLVPRKTFNRILREYAARSKSGESVSVWDLMREEGVLTEGRCRTCCHRPSARLGNRLPTRA